MLPFSGPAGDDLPSRMSPDPGSLLPSSPALADSGANAHSDPVGGTQAAIFTQVSIILPSIPRLPAADDDEDVPEPDDPGCLDDLVQQDLARGSSEGFVPEEEPENPELDHPDMDDPHTSPEGELSDDEDGARGYEDDNVFEIPKESPITELQWSLDFIHATRQATLDNSGLDPEILARLRKPICTPVLKDLDEDFLWCLDLYLNTANASNEAYENIRRATEKRFNVSLLSLAQLRTQIREITGVVPLRSHMCPSSCLAFTGPFEEDETCRICGKSRWDPHKLEKGVKSPAYTFDTLLLAPPIGCSQAIS